MQSMCKKQYCKRRKGYEEKLQIRSNLPKERHSGETVILGKSEWYKERYSYHSLPLLNAWEAMKYSV